jgi:hypothetical protein
VLDISDCELVWKIRMTCVCLTGDVHVTAKYERPGRLSTSDALDEDVQIGGACGFRGIVCETRRIGINHEVLHRL